MRIEIDLSKLERGTHIGRVKVTRGGKTFYRKQRIGVKETEKQQEVKVQPPDPELLGVLMNDRQAMDVEPDGTFKIATKEFGDIKMRLEGNSIVNPATGLRVTVPDNLGEKIEKDSYCSSWHVCKFLIDGEMGNSWDNDYETDIKGMEEYEKTMGVIEEGDWNKYDPEYEDATEEGTGKYSRAMKLKINLRKPIIWNSTVPKSWYGGESNDFMVPVCAMKDIMDGKFDENNILHPGLKPIIEASKIVAKEHGAKNIYRGETNIKKASEIIDSVVQDGSFELPDRFASWTENEKLGRWYAATHQQNAPSSQTQTKTNVMLRVDKERYLPNVALDYRVCGGDTRPEEEITITGKGIKLTGNDVLVYAKVGEKKRNSWMTLNEYIESGGLPSQLHDNMSIGRRK